MDERADEAQVAAGGRGVLGRVVRLLVLSMGWFVFLAGLAALWLEEIGVLNHWAETELAAHLGSIASTLSVRETDLSWTSRTIRLRGIAFGEDQDLTVEELELLVGWSPRLGLHLQRAVARGGHLRVSPELITSIQDLVETQGGGGGAMETFEAGDPFPTLGVSDLSISVETPRGSDIRAGTLAAILEPGADGRPKLSGQLVPADEGRGEVGVITLTGQLGDGGVLDVHGEAHALPLTTTYLPEGTLFEELRVLEPRAVFDLEADGRFVVGQDVLPRVDATVSITGGSIRLPWLEEGSARRVEDIELRLAATFEPTGPLSLWDREAWSAVAEAGARWQGIEGTAFARLGRRATPGALGEAWVHMADLPLEAEALDLLNRPRWLTELWQGFAPRGTAEVVVGLRLPDTWQIEDGFDWALEQGVAILPGGRAEAAYVGGPGDGGVRNLGFPLPLQGLEGMVTYVQWPGRDFPEEVGIFGLAGQHGSGTARVDAVGHFARRDPTRRDVRPPAHFHLVVGSDQLAVDDTLRQAFAGLVGVSGCQQIWADYAPQAGYLGFRLEFWQTPERPDLATDLSIDFHRVGFRWAELPVRLNAMDGRFTLLTDGAGPQGLAAITLDLRGSSDAARGPVRVVGRTEMGVDPETRSRWEVRADAVNLRSSHLRGVLARQAPKAEEALESTAVSGFVDLEVTHVQTALDVPELTWIQVHSTADGLRVQPRIYPMDTRDVRGRLITEMVTQPLGPGGSEPPEPTQMVRFGMLGAWGNGRASIPIWAEGIYPPSGAATVRALGAGLEVSSPAVAGALEAMLVEADDEPVEFDLSQFDRAGTLDVEAEFRLSDDDESELLDSSIAIQLRLDRFGLADVNLLEDLRGRLTYSKWDETWIGRRLTAVLGRTPVTLSDLRFTQKEGLATLTTRVTAKALPIDRPHLSYFFDEQTLNTVLDDFELRGWFDVRDGLLSVVSTPEGEKRVHFTGQLQVNNMFVRLGLPVSIRSTKQVDLDLFFEGSRVRAVARIQGLYGQVAERSLDDASMQITYIEPRLTIERFNGRFEGGMLHSLGHDASTSSGFFSIDFEKPYPFALSAEMASVDVGQLLRGVFNSDFANQGHLDAEIRLYGDIDRLTDIRGSGGFVLRDSALWAIPVFQSLFAQLGFETTAIFSRMESRYTIADGVVDMTRMRLKSDLLSLVGEGSVDFDGSLKHDLEVRYSLVDKLGPLTRLLYFIQNSLLRIAIRGDMSRPEVVVKGLISRFFGSSEDVQRLPLPGFGELWRRF